MDFVVTEASIYEAGGKPLQPLTLECARKKIARILADLKLPRGAAGGATEGYSSPPCYAHEVPGYFGERENGAS